MLLPHDVVLIAHFLDMLIFYAALYDAGWLCFASEIVIVRYAEPLCLYWIIAFLLTAGTKFFFSLLVPVLLTKIFCLWFVLTF